MQKCRKNPVCGTGTNPLAKNELLHLLYPRLYKSEKKIIKICLPLSEENCRKTIKLLLEKNDVKKYLVHQLPFERASKKATFGAW